MLSMRRRCIRFAEFNRTADQTGTEIRLAFIRLGAAYKSAHDTPVVASGGAAGQTVQMTLLLATSVLSDIG
jgi:hypothetical protein